MTPRRVLPPSRNFLGVDRSHAAYESARIAIVPAPYEHTVSYGRGTGRGPAAILAASRFVEYWDEIFERELCFETGIATLPPIVFGQTAHARAIERIERTVGAAIDDGKFVLTLGGEHTISAGTIRAHFERYPTMGVLQFDAHSDLRDTYEGTRFSHACVMARVLEFLPPKRLVQVGIRAQCREEFETIASRGIRTFFARDLHDGRHGTPWHEAVVRALPRHVYVSFDVDYFDPSIMHATGTPEPGGFMWDDTVRLLRAVGSARRIVGADIVELAPVPSLPSATYLAAKLAYKILNAAFNRRPADRAR